MRIIRDFEHCPQSAKGAVVALGNFDGLHRGHQEILRACIKEAKNHGALPAVMTFEPHPREFFGKLRGSLEPLRIYTLRRKLKLLEELGIETVFLARFNKALAATSAESFIQDILHRQLAIKHVITGYNFAFGKGREGNTEFLEKAARQAGIGFTCVSPIENGQGKDISSSAIRASLAEGNIAAASDFLGRPYSIGGRVQSGDARGRVLGFPTANLWLKTLFRPRFGIYAARVTFSKTGEVCDAVASLGIRPMFRTERPLLEVHCFGISRMFYGEHIEVELLEFIRDEAKYDEVEQLRAQIAVDCETAKQMLGARHG